MSDDLAHEIAEALESAGGVTLGEDERAAIRKTVEKARRCETCNAECDALGHCLGSCQGEEWDR